MLNRIFLFTKIQHSFATKLQAASTKNTKDSPGKHLGVKKFGGEFVFPNDILLRQRGLKWKAGHNTLIGKDHTIHATKEGSVKFTKQYKRGRKITTVHVLAQHSGNHKVRPAPPYCYHPELYPELSKSNPEPTNWPIGQRKPREIKYLRSDYPKLSELSASIFAIEIPVTWGNKLVEASAEEREQNEVNRLEGVREYLVKKSGI